MLIGLLAIITAGLWIFGFVALARIFYAAFTGKAVPGPIRSDLWPLVGFCFAAGVVMLLILGILGFFQL